MAIAAMRGALERAAARRAAEQRYDAPRPARLLIAVDQVERLFVEAAAGQGRSLCSDAARVGRCTARLRGRGVAQRLLRALPARRRSWRCARPAARMISCRRPARSSRTLSTRPVAACRPPLAFEVEAAAARWRRRWSPTPGEATRCRCCSDPATALRSAGAARAGGAGARRQRRAGATRRASGCCALRIIPAWAPP